MALISWKDVYATGIVALDNEHRELVEQINQLGEAIRDRSGGEVLQDVLAVLDQYTGHHFSHEERLMQEYGFPGLDEHRQIHQQLRAKVKEIKQDSDTAPELVAQELYKLLRRWLLEHIVEIDKKYGPYLESRGGRFIS